MFSLKIPGINRDDGKYFLLRSLIYASICLINIFLNDILISIVVGKPYEISFLYFRNSTWKTFTNDTHLFKTTYSKPNRSPIDYFD